MTRLIDSVGRAGAGWALALRPNEYLNPDELTAIPWAPAFPLPAVLPFSAIRANQWEWFDFFFSREPNLD